MLERLPRAEISRERKRADELGCADRPLCTPRARAGSCWVGLHGEILEAPQRSFASASRTSYSQIGWREPYGSSSRDRRVARVAAPLLVAVVGESDNAAYDVLTKQNLPLPNVVVRAPRLITKANIGSVSSWSNELAQIKRGTLSR
jgi:hypothetical protein